MVQITPLVFIVAGLSHLTDSTPLNGLAVRQTMLDPSALPSACQSPCQVVNDVTECAGTLNCICTSKMGKLLEQCMNCLVGVQPTAKNESESALGSWNESCGGHLSLSKSVTGGADRIETGSRMAMRILVGLASVTAFTSL